MNISYTAPLSRAWERMKSMLFRRPFEIETWIVVGFSAWLADLLSSGGSGGSRWNGSEKDFSHGVSHARDQVQHWLESPAVLMVIAIVLVSFLLLMVLLTWVSARAQFVFLENVLEGRAAFVAPWRRSGKLGNSLFLWWAAMSFTWLLPLGALFVPLRGVGYALVRGIEPQTPDLVMTVIGVVAAVVMALLIGIAYWLMTEFVVPLMYRHQESAGQAWGRFIPLLTSHLGDFIAYMAFVIVLAIGVALGSLLVGVLSCCVGLVLMVIPYVGTVVLLPVHVAARALGPEFLRQFGPEWDVFPVAAAPLPEPEPLEPQPPYAAPPLA